MLQWCIVVTYLMAVTEIPQWNLTVGIVLDLMTSAKEVTFYPAFVCQSNSSGVNP